MGFMGFVGGGCAGFGGGGLGCVWLGGGGSGLCG